MERSFAHVGETGGAGRTWLRGKLKINKRYLIHVAARNLGLLMRDLFGIGKPRVLQGLSSSWFSTYLATKRLLNAFPACPVVLGRPQRTKTNYQVATTAA